MELYKTGNPVPSAGMPDLWDNTRVLDALLNSLMLEIESRTGEKLPSWKGIIKNINDLINDTRQNLIPLSRQYMTLADAQADIANIPEGSTTYVRSIDGSSLADEYINNGGTLEPTGRKMMGNGVIDLNEDESTAVKLVDSNGNSILSIDMAGEIYSPHSNGISIQEQIRDLHPLRETVKKNDAPYISRMTDAQSLTMEIVDQNFGDHFVPGMDSQSLQQVIRKMKDNAATQFKASAIFDGWHDFGICWRGNNRAWTFKKIQAAIDYISTLQYGGTLFLRAGVYPLYSPIVPRSNVTLIMERGARLLPIRGLSAIQREITSSDISGYLKNAAFIDVEIDGSEQYTTGEYRPDIKGMFITGFSECIFLRCNIHDTGATGLGIDYADKSFILDGRFNGCGRLAPVGAGGASGIGIGSGANQDEPLIISRNFCSNNKNNGIFIEQQRLSFSTNVSRQIIVSDNVSTRNNHGFSDCGASGIIVTGNQFNDNISHGVVMDTGTLTPDDGRPQPGQAGLLVNNQILRNGGHGVLYDGRSVAAGGQYTYDSNLLRDNAGSGYVFAAGTNEIPELRISGGEVSRNAGIPVVVESGIMTNFDIDNLRMLNNGGDTHIRIDGNINGGTIWSNRMRSLSASAISGTGNISDVDISGNQYMGANDTPLNLSGEKNNITFGRNVGF